MNTRIIATPEVWLEGEAERQLEAVAANEDCRLAVGMPDLHPGPGIPIGAAFAFAKTVHPRLVGSDAGCGALFVGIDKHKVSSNVERRIRTEFESPFLDGVDREALCRAVWQRGPAGLVDFDISDVTCFLGETLAPEDIGESGELPSSLFGAALGTIGGGNHFAEVGQVKKVVDKEAAQALGLRQGSIALLCHSGSRGLGKALADKWGHQALSQEQAGQYLSELAGAIRFAKANRVLLAARLLRALGVSRSSKLSGAFDCVHNDVCHEDCESDMLWVHRKGCAKARKGQLALVLGSRGTPSWIMRGRGNPKGLQSVAHGAGRKMQRSEARAKIRDRYKRKQLHKSPLGGTLICDDKALLYEEHPDAYKAIEPVIDSLVKAKLADRVASIEPLFTVKK